MQDFLSECLRTMKFRNCGHSKNRLQFRKLRGKISMAREGALQIFDTVQNIAGDKADLKAWEEKIRNYREDDEVSSVIEPSNDEDESLPLTLGMIGHPVSISYLTTL